MKILSLPNYVISLQPSGSMIIEDIHRRPVPIRGGTILPENPEKMVIPAEDVSKLRQFLNAAAPES